MKGMQMDIGPYTISHGARPWPRRRRLGGAAAATMLALAALAVPAGAANNGTATGTVTIAVRSVSVSPDTFSYDNCTSSSGQTDGLVIPNGTCSTAQNALTVTNGSVPAEIEVGASNFVPADNGMPWQICIGVAPHVCTGTSFAPGADQAKVSTFVPVGTHLYLDNAPACDRFMNGQCGEAAAGVSGQEGVEVVGPLSSTDQSPTFSNTITWIAVP